MGNRGKSQRNVYLLWGTMPSIWAQIKDFMLCIALLSALVSRLGAFSPETITIVREEIAAPAEAAEHTIQEKEDEPKIEEEETQKKLGEFSAYSSEVGQTDNDPFTMANGKKVHSGAIANNCLAFGTAVEVYGMGIFTVEDRMNKRYDCSHFDIWMDSTAKALKHGRKTITYSVK